MIEAVGAEGAALCARLHAAAFPEAWSAGEIARLMENPATIALIARTDGSPAAAQGFVMIWVAAGDSELLTLAVAPEARRKGVGAELVSGACAAALLRGAAMVHLEVAEDNVAARALYAKLGFEAAGRRAGYYLGEGGGADAIVLRRTLPRPEVR